MVDLSIQAIGKADAVGIVAAIDKAFLDETDMQPNEWCYKTVGTTDVPHLISVHCVAHRLEPGIKDSIKHVAYLAKVEDFLLSI